MGDSVSSLFLITNLEMFTICPTSCPVRESWAALPRLSVRGVRIADKGFVGICFHKSLVEEMRRVSLNESVARYCCSCCCCRVCTAFRNSVVCFALLLREFYLYLWYSTSWLSRRICGNTSLLLTPERSFLGLNRISCCIKLCTLFAFRSLRLTAPTSFWLKKVLR